MIADLVEDSELQTQHLSDGISIAAVTFTRKIVQGAGVVSATIILSIAQFPTGVLPGDVPQDVLFTLGALYAPPLCLLWMTMIGCLSIYRIDRTQ